MEFYECEQCGSQTTIRNAVHINYRMQFDPAFGTWGRTSYVHCCVCTDAIGGQTCDHEAGLWK